MALIVEIAEIPRKASDWPIIYGSAENLFKNERFTVENVISRSENENLPKFKNINRILWWQHEQDLVISESTWLDQTNCLLARARHVLKKISPR